MDGQTALEFLHANHRCVLATMRRDGTPQLSPVVAAVDASGRVVVSTRRTSIKVANLQRDPRMWLCVFPDGFFGPWLQVSGPVEILTLPAAMEPLVDYYRLVAGEHDNWAEYRDAMVREERVLLRLVPDRVGPATNS